MAYRGVIAVVAACLLFTAGCSDRSDSSGTFVGDASSGPSGPSEVPSDAPTAPSEPPASEPASPSPPPASPGGPSASPDGPSASPGGAPEQPSGQDDAGGTTIEVGAQAWPGEQVGMDTATPEWIRAFGIDGLVYPAGEEVQLLEVIVFTIADSQDRSASLFYDLYSDRSAQDIAASFEQVIGSLGDYTFSNRTEGKSLILTGSGAGLRDRYEITVRSEPDQDRYTVQVVRNWSATDDAIPASITDRMQPAISVADSVGFTSGGWRYYEGLDYDAYNRTGRRTYKLQVDYHLTTASGDPDENVNLVGNATAISNRKQQQNGVVFNAAGSEWIFYSTSGGGGNIQFKR